MKLTINEHPIDRMVRVVIGAILLVAGALAGVAAPLLYAVLAVGAILLVTGAVGFCPLYAILGVRTAGK
jgi:hypothetical protein